MIEPNNSDNVCGLTWLLLIIREACVPLTSWSELGSAERMMEALTRHSPVPERMTVATNETLQIGSIIIRQPLESTLKKAKLICESLKPVLVNITYVCTIKMYNGIILTEDQMQSKQTIPVVHVDWGHP